MLCLGKAYCDKRAGTTTGLLLERREGHRSHPGASPELDSETLALQLSTIAAHHVGCGTFRCVEASLPVASECSALGS